MSVLLGKMKTGVKFWMDKYSRGEKEVVPFARSHVIEPNLLMQWRPLLDRYALIQTNMYLYDLTINNTTSIDSFFI